MSLLQEMFSSKDVNGANQILIQGRMGSGKTTVMRAYAHQAIEKGHCVIWRARPNRDQWHLLEGERKILIPEGSKVNFSLKVEDELHEYSGPADIMRKLQKGLNIIIEPTMTKPWDALFWLAFWHFLNERKRFDWVTMIYDELKDTFPSQSYGPYYFIMPQISSVFRDMRRSNTELMASIHEPRDIHWDWIGKWQGIIYMHGAQAIQTKRVRKGLLSHLEPGHIIAEQGDRFADIQLHIPDSQYPKSLISYSLETPTEYQERMDQRTWQYLRSILPQDIISEISSTKSKKKPKITPPKVEIEEVS